MLAVNIALALQPLSACTDVDTDNDGVVEIHELVRAVGAALFDCLRPACPNYVPGAAVGSSRPT